MTEDSEDFIRWPCDNRKGYLKAYEGDACGFAYTPSEMQKSVLHGVSFALLTKRGGGGVCVVVRAEEPDEERSATDNRGRVPLQVQHDLP